MQDPVILPSSKTVIDRSSIKQHYLSDRTDPFNRQPFEWEDIQDAVELKGQIQAWLDDRKKSRQSAQAVNSTDGGATAAAEGVQEEKMQVDE